MVYIFYSKVIKCPVCKQTKVIPAHGDVVLKTDIIFCESCGEKMTFVKKSNLIDWIKHPKDLIALQTKKIKYLFSRKY
ncbi:hypothetical protein [Acinetobacter indicus]|uniref:Uncharacterized protein n=1 Tax=Acinetobacter indicus TaxID=756892 RepID=A0AAW8Z7G8_9GAMM|nr:hypothetical protein [Acinetobacter indicus]MDV4317100.1 hypothetical protein [Acinetobacter indicus]